MLPWAAMGIGALMGGLSSKQRGGNFLKGALQGAALGGITGGIGKSAVGSGGIFGLGKKMLPNMLAMAGIGMGSEMLGQGEANKLRMEQTRKWLDDEEERRIARLSRIAGYDVADSANFMTPNKYFSARGGYKTRPQYQLGGISSLEDDPMDAVNIQELQMDPGTMSPGGLTEEFDYMDEASLSPEIQKLYRAFLVANQATEEEVPVEMFMQIMQQQGGGQQGPMMAAEGGQVNRPGYAWGGGIEEEGGPPRSYPKSGPWDRSWHDKLWEDGKFIGDPGFYYTPEKQDIPFGADTSGAKKTFPIQTPWGIKEGSDPFFYYTPDKENYDEDNPWGIKKVKKPWAEGGSVMGKDEYDEELNRPQYAPGGIADLDLRGGGASVGPGTGTSDDIPAMLSDGEFVVTANAVQNLGGGDRMLGAKRMYRMMNQLDPNSQTPAEMSGVGYA